MSAPEVLYGYRVSDQCHDDATMTKLGAELLRGEDTCGDVGSGPPVAVSGNGVTVRKLCASKRSGGADSPNEQKKKRHLEPPRAPTMKGVPKELIVAPLLRSNATCAGCGLSMSYAYRCKRCDEAVHFFVQWMPWNWDTGRIMCVRNVMLRLLNGRN